MSLELSERTKDALIVVYNLIHNSITVDEAKEALESIDQEHVQEAVQLVHSLLSDKDLSVLSEANIALN